MNDLSKFFLVFKVYNFMFKTHNKIRPQSPKEKLSKYL